MDGPVKGRTTAFAGHANFHAYTGMWDADTDTAFLMKYGAHQADEMGQPQRLEAWHGSICYPVAGEPDHGAARRPPSTPPTRTTGCTSGSGTARIGFFTLPCVPDPAACDQYRFSLDPSWVVFPNWHGGFPSSVKPLRYVAVSGDNLDSEKYATVSYRTDPVSADAISVDALAAPDRQLRHPAQRAGRVPRGHRPAGGGSASGVEQRGHHRLAPDHQPLPALAPEHRPATGVRPDTSWPRTA